LPALFELRQQSIGTTHGVRVTGHALRATVLPLGHQMRTFQHGDVLLHGGKRHLVSRGQLADGRIGVHHACQDVAPRGISQRPEQMVQVVGRRLSIYNHMVVDSSTSPAEPKPGSSEIIGPNPTSAQIPVSMWTTCLRL